MLTTVRAEAADGGAEGGIVDGEAAGGGIVVGGAAGGAIAAGAVGDTAIMILITTPALQSFWSSRVLDRPMGAAAAGNYPSRRPT